MLADKQLEAQTLAAMLNNQIFLDDCMAVLTPDDFDNRQFREIFGIIQTMYQAGKKIDQFTVYEEAKNVARGLGTEWLLLKEACWDTGTLQFAIEKLQSLRRARELACLCKETFVKLKNGESTDKVLQDTENRLYAITMQRREIKIMTPQEQAERMLQTLSKRMEHKSNGGIKTRYIKLNYAMNGGFLPGQLVIIAAQTGRGKTAFTMDLMYDISIMQKHPALYINTEMSEEQMDCRWMTKMSGIEHSKIASGQVTDEEAKIIVSSLDKMYKSGFYCVTIPDLTINTLISTARRFKAQKDMKVLVVDYVGRMDTSDPKLQEWQVYKLIAKRLKTLAQELQITVIMLAQITDEGNLEGAKGMKNECDLFAYLREMTEEESLSFVGQYNYFLCLDKNRDGRRIKIPLRFIGEKLTFEGKRQMKWLDANRNRIKILALQKLRQQLVQDAVSGRGDREACKIAIALVNKRIAALYHGGKLTNDYLPCRASEQYR